MLSAPFGHCAISPVIGQLSRSKCNLPGSFVDELPPLRIIPAHWQPQMPVQRAGNQLGRYQIVHTAILRLRNNFLLQGRTGSPQKVADERGAKRVDNCWRRLPRYLEQLTLNQRISSANRPCATGAAFAYDAAAPW